MSFTWGTVTSVSPLRVQLDGDSSALPFTPDSLIDPLVLAVDDRVRCELSERRIVIHGRSGGDGVTPAGSEMMFAGSTAPAGWLLEDGASYLRADYPALFAVIGTTYGAANGSSFNVPDMRGRVPVGRDSGQAEFDVLGESGGAKTHTLTIAEMPVHSHFQRYATAGAGGVNQFDTGTTAAGSGGRTSVEATAAAGSGQAHNNLQPYRVRNFIIKT